MKRLAIAELHADQLRPFCTVTLNELHLFLCNAVKIVWSPSSVWMKKRCGHVKVEINTDNSRVEITSKQLKGLGYFARAFFSNVDFRMDMNSGYMWIWATVRHTDQDPPKKMAPTTSLDELPEESVDDSDSDENSDGLVDIGFVDNITLLTELWKAVPHTSSWASERQHEKPGASIVGMCANGYTEEMYGRLLWVDVSKRWIDFSAYDLLAGKGAGKQILRRLQNAGSVSDKTKTKTGKQKKDPNHPYFGEGAVLQEDDERMAVPSADKVVKLLGFMADLIGGKGAAQITVHRGSVPYKVDKIFGPTDGVIVVMTADTTFVRRKSMLFSLMSVCSVAFDGILDVPWSSRDEMIAKILTQPGQKQYSECAILLVPWVTEPLKVPEKILVRSSAAVDAYRGHCPELGKVIAQEFGDRDLATKEELKAFLRGLVDIIWSPPRSSVDLIKIEDAGCDTRAVFLVSKPGSHRLCTSQMHGVARLVKEYFGEKVTYTTGFGRVHFFIGTREKLDKQHEAFLQPLCDCHIMGGPHPTSLDHVRPDVATSLFQWLVQYRWIRNTTTPTTITTTTVTDNTTIITSIAPARANGWTVQIPEGSTGMIIWMLLTGKFMEDNHISTNEAIKYTRMALLPFVQDSYEFLEDCNIVFPDPIPRLIQVGAFVTACRIRCDVPRDFLKWHCQSF